MKGWPPAYVRDCDIIPTRNTDVESYFLNLNHSFSDNQSDNRYLKGNSNSAVSYTYLSLCVNYCTILFTFFSKIKSHGAR